MRNKFIAVSLVFGIIAFLLSPVLWPNPPGGLEPGPGLVPFFMIYGLIESLAFGIGVAFLIFYWQRFMAHRLLFLSVVWMLVSWWPHDNLHRILAHDNFAGLLGLEYGFHFTLILAAIVVVRYLTQTVRK